MSFKRAVSCRYLVGDVALYTTDTIQSLDKQKQYFISRVPVKISQAAKSVASAQERPFYPVEGTEGYEAVEITSDYAQVRQRWVLYRSEQARKIEKKTLLKRILKRS